MNYIIVSSEHLERVNFSEVAQTSPESIRYSLDGKKFLLKYEGDQPKFVYAITNDAIGLPEFTHEKILEVLNNDPEWKKQG